MKENTKFKTMKDVETVLRFFALRKIDLWDGTTFSKFLDKYALRANDLPELVLPDYKVLFENTIKFAYDLFGDKAFCMWKINKSSGQYRWTKRPTLLIYDALMNVLSNYLEWSEQIIEQRNDVVSEFETLFQENDTLLNGRDTSKNAIQGRIDIFNNYFQTLIVR